MKNYFFNSNIFIYQRSKMEAAEINTVRKVLKAQKS